MSEYQSANEYLVTLKKRGVHLGLQRMERWAEALGHPESTVPCVHVAGTNGKGSVAAMLAAIIRTAGLRTGLYTSPHLVKLGERVQVDGVSLKPEDIVAAIGELAPLAAGLVTPATPDAHPSYFEFMTGLAFRHFSRRRCDFNVIEAGVGGRLDATNIVKPEVSIITSIGLDHCDLLGDSLEKIAAEKAGIIKLGCPVVLGRLPKSAELVIRAIALERNARVWSVTEEFSDSIARCPQTNLAGDYQRWNAAVAMLAIRLLPARWRLYEAIVTRGLQQVVWPGRWQRLTLGKRFVILDASHNAEGAQVLEANLTQLTAETGRAPVVVVGVLGAARAKPLFEVIGRHAGEIHLVVPQQSRACSHAQLAALVPASYRGAVRRSTLAELFPAPGASFAGEGDAPVVVTGSIYLVGEVLACLEPARGPVESELQDF